MDRYIGEYCCLQHQGTHVVSLYLPSHSWFQKKPMFVVTAVRTSNYIISTMTQVEKHKLRVWQEELLRGIYISGLESLSIADYQEKYESWLKNRERRKEIWRFMMLLLEQGAPAEQNKSLLLLGVTESCVSSVADTTGTLNSPRPYIAGWEALWPGWSVYIITRRQISHGNLLQLKCTLCHASDEHEKCVGIRSTSYRTQPMLFLNFWITSFAFKT
jgi:hypothetical protein